MISCMNRRHLLGAVFPLVLAACAGLPPASPTGNKTIAAGAQAYHQSIEMGGRLSVRYQNNGRDEALHGNFTWVQTPSQTLVTLLSPLGQTLAIVEVTPEGATLKQAGQPPRSADNVNALTADTLGWPLPVAGLRDWLQGLALDSRGMRFVATPTAPQVTTHDGWHLRYANWQGENSSPLRPKRIDLGRFTEQAGDVSIRIVIDSWQIL